jgi:cyclophilin family peptidyl-prolyl cis-trans isomerase
VVLQAIDQLKTCGHSEDAVERLLEIASLDSGRSTSEWHRVAHALVALAAAAPDQARSLVVHHRTAEVPQVRVYAARAATLVGDRATLERLAADPDDNVVEAAIDGLASGASPESADVFAAALERRGYQALRAAARALKRAESSEELVATLQATLVRLSSENQPNSIDVRTAIADTLAELGAPSVKTKKAIADRPSELMLADLQRLASPRARLTIRGGGRFDLALITREAPATVVQFVRLAASGYYNGLTFHRVAPNFVIQGGSPAANEYVGHPDHMRDEVGLWPHVRGAVGISTRGRDTGDAQIFIDLVDNPRLDHEYTVFAYVVAGMDVVDRIMEGDVIERVEILDVR